VAIPGIAEILQDLNCDLRNDVRHGQNLPFAIGNDCCPMTPNDQVERRADSIVHDLKASGQRVRTTDGLGVRFFGAFAETRP
jgi:hypothetical protein